MKLANTNGHTDEILSYAYCGDIYRRNCPSLNLSINNDTIIPTVFAKGIVVGKVVKKRQTVR